jgi:hypothetical protein
MRRTLLILLPLTLLLSLTSGCGSLNQKYVEADRKKYESVASEYLLYVDADESLDAEDKAIRRHNIKMWLIRIEEAEKFLGLRQAKREKKDSIWDGWEPW